MITKELAMKKTCLFCASDYHLEMILLPYIKEKIDDSKIIVLTQDSLCNTVDILLEKVNISQNIKEKIKNLDWNSNDEKKISEIEKNLKYRDVNVVINGEYNYIKEMNQKLKGIENVNIIDCYHIDDKDVNISKLSKEYYYILNTRKK